MKRIIIFSLLLFASMVVTTTNAQSGSVNVTYNGNCDWTISFNIAGLDPNSPVFIDASVNEIGCGDHGPGSGWTNWQYGNTDSNGNVSLAVIHGGWGSFSYTFRTTSKTVVVDFSYGNPNETSEVPPSPFQDFPPNVEAQPNELNPEVQIQNQPQPNDNFFRGSMYALSGDYIQVGVSGLNIRTGPSTRNTSLGHVVNGNYYQLIEQSNGWGRISTSRGEGWVYLSRSYVTIYGQTDQNNQRWLWCQVQMDAIDLGGGTWDDRNYILEWRGPNLGGYEIYIYYNDEWIYFDPHGYIDGVNRWGVSTFWAYRHPNWLDDWRWRLDFHYQGQCP